MCFQKEVVRASTYDVDDHILELDALGTKYTTGVNANDVRSSIGLTSDEAKARLAANGPNALTPPKKEPEILKFFRHLTNQLLLLLVIAATLSVITYGIDKSAPVNLWLGLILYGVVLITATMGYWNVSWKAVLRAVWCQLC